MFPNPCFLGWTPGPSASLHPFPPLCLSPQLAFPSQVRVLQGRFPAYPVPPARAEGAPEWWSSAPSASSLPSWTLGTNRVVGRWSLEREEGEMEPDGGEVARRKVDAHPHKIPPTPALMGRDSQECLVVGCGVSLGLALEPHPPQSKDVPPLRNRSFLQAAPFAKLGLSGSLLVSPTWCSGRRPKIQPTPTPSVTGYRP